ncbi:MAG: M13 family metallopeptidase [Alphaproteobacteria bacterium]|nr:M13 family metallopeptidase [Alphaproteobacteria bacterium]
MRLLPMILAGAVVAGLAASPACAGKPEFGSWGVDLSAMDTSVAPGNNFFKYVNGTWLKHAVIPADRTSTGVWLDIAIRTEHELGTIVTELRAKPYGELTPDDRKLRDLYAAFMNVKALDAAGLKPAEPDLARFAHLASPDAIAAAMAQLAAQTYNPFFGGGDSVAPFALSIEPDEKNPSRYALYVSQSGLGMPNRDYYLSKNPAITKTRRAYRAWLVKMMTLAGLKNPKARAARVYALEAAIAKVSRPAAARRNVLKNYNPMTVSQLEEFAPGFPWKLWLAASGVTPQGPHGQRIVIATDKSALPAIAKIFAHTPASTWADYLTVHYLHAFAEELPQTIERLNFDFYGKALLGEKSQLKRATRAVHLLDQQMGFALGRLYVARYFPPEAKAKAEQLVANLRRAYELDIPTLTWMSAKTKAKALQKLKLLVPHIGYPDKWVNYGPLEINRTTLLADIQRAGEFRWRRRTAHLDAPVDRSEWFMTPPTLNAYYDPMLNEIVFPAAILQPPFFDPNADDAVNYGAIGAVIGHEMSHGYDDQGSRFDAQGVLHNWWTKADRAAFDARTKALTDQYDTYEPVPGIHINGKLTLGENIADLAGLTIAYKAYHLSLHGKPAPVLNGFTGDQRFFLAYGQVWRTKTTADALRRQLLSDPHSPGEFRVIGTTRNLDPWYKAFDVKPGSKYYLPPDKRVHLW